MKEAVLNMRGKTEELLCMPQYIYIVCLAAFIFHIFALDLIGIMTFAILGGLFLVLFDDVRPGFTLIFTTIFIVSTQNSPGYGKGEEYYAKPEIIYPLLVTLGFVVLCMAARTIIRRKNLLDGKSYIPFALLSAVMLLSGIGHPEANFYKESLLYAAFGLFSYLVLYVLFTGCIDRSEGLFDYVANLMTALCLLISLEVLFVYVLNMFPPFEWLPANWKKYMTGGEFNANWKNIIITGWGVSNVAGELIVMTAPFVFYKMLHGNKKYTVLYALVIFFSATMIFFTLSRNAMLFGGVLYIALFIYTFIKTDKKKTYALCLGGYFGFLLAVVIAILGQTDIHKVFDYIGEMLAFGEINGDGVHLKWHGRDKLIRIAFDYFREDIWLGGGFAKSLHVGAYAVRATFFQALFHNFVFQAIGSGGILGIIAMLVFVGYAVKTFSGKYKNNVFMLAFAISFGLMALFDTIYYIPYTVMFLVLMIVVTEKTKYNAEVKLLKNE